MVVEVTITGGQEARGSSPRTPTSTGVLIGSEILRDARSLHGFYYDA